MDEYEWTWPQIRDAIRERAKRLGATYQPHFILLDDDGRIVDTWEGGGDESIWSAMLAKLP